MSSFLAGTSSKEGRPLSQKSRSTGELLPGLRHEVDKNGESDQGMCLVVEAVVPEGYSAYDLISVVLPGGGRVVARAPVGQGSRFRVVVTEGTAPSHNSASPISLLERELEEEAAEAEGTALPLEGILQRDSWAPYFLDFLHQRDDDGRLVLLYLECEQHKGLVANSEDELARVLCEHEVSVYETYASKRAPKFACRGIPRSVLARLERRRAERSPCSRDALSELGDAILQTLHARWYPDFLASESYRKLLRDLVAVDEAECVERSLEDAAADGLLRRYLLAAQNSEQAKRAVLWWCRIKGRLLRLCESMPKLPRALAEQARAEVRGNAHRLLARPPLVLGKDLADRLSTLFKRERVAFDVDTASSMYASLLAEVAEAMRPELEATAWRPFARSTSYLEYVVAAREDDTNPMDRVMRAVFQALAATPTSRRRLATSKNPLFVWMADGQLHRAPCSPMVMRSGLTLLCVDSRATRYCLFDDDDGPVLEEEDEEEHDEELQEDKEEEDTSSEELSPFTMLGLREPGSPTAGAWRRSATDEAAIELGLLTLCDERKLPHLITALILELPVALKCADKKRRAKLAKRLRALSDALPLRATRMSTTLKIDDDQQPAVCRAATDDSLPPAITIEERDCHVTDAVPEPPRRASAALVRAVRCCQIATLQTLDASADDTAWRRPLPVAQNQDRPCVDALDRFLDDLFFKPIRLFATRPSDHHHVVAFDLAILNRFNQSLPFYHALLQSRRFADALIDACFWNGSGPDSPAFPRGHSHFSWVLPRNALNSVTPDDPTGPSRSAASPTPVAKTSSAFLGSSSP